MPLIGSRRGARRGPGLLRTVGRTAAIAGTATAVSGAVQRRQAEHRQPPPAAPPPSEPQPPTGPPPAGSVVDQLERLLELKKQGVLTEAEFETQKARILTN